MTSDVDPPSETRQPLEPSRRAFLQAAGVSLVALASSRELLAALAQPDMIVPADKRFPYFRSTPVSYLDVKMQDTFWAPRQKTIREVTLAWATHHWDAAGGLEAYRAQPATYRAKTQPGDMEAVKFIEAMATVVGIERDPAIEGLIDAWAKVLIEGQGADGYLQAGLGVYIAHPPKPWQPFPGSHESYLIGHYLESALAYRESTGSTALYDSAIRAIDNMVLTLLDSQRPYTIGHAGIEHALMRLYESTGNTKYMRLSAWLIAQRGDHAGRTSAGKGAMDHIAVKDQRIVEGHAVQAAYLFNGVTEYVGATGDAAYRETVLSTWKDATERKMYLQGAAGNASAGEDYPSEPYNISPGDTYGESCASFGNFQWAHSLFRLTGDASYLDVAERILYNAFCASLSLKGDSYFYHNVSQNKDPVLRYDWHRVPCCPPNIVKLFCKVGGFFYSTDKEGIFIKHYGASEVDIPFGKGVKLIQRGNYPWEGDISVQVQPRKPVDFTLRLRIPTWAKSHSLSLNGKVVQGDVHQGWVAIRRRWRAGDRVELSLPMTVNRVTLPPEFKHYRRLAALQRGPIVYCLEQQDSPARIEWLHFPEDATFTAEHRPELLGGVTVLKGELRQATIWYDIPQTSVPVTFIPYGVWNNRKPGGMTIWLVTQPWETMRDMLTR